MRFPQTWPQFSRRSRKQAVTSAGAPGANVTTSNPSGPPPPELLPVRRAPAQSPGRQPQGKEEGKTGLGTPLGSDWPPGLERGGAARCCPYHAERWVGPKFSKGWVSFDFRYVLGTWPVVLHTYCNTGDFRKRGQPHFPPLLSIRQDGDKQDGGLIFLFLF